MISRPLAVAAVLAASVLASAATQARNLPNVDALGSAPPAKATAKAKVAARAAHVRDAHFEERLDLPTFLRFEDGAEGARAKAGRSAEAAAREHLGAHADLYRLTPDEVRGAVVHKVEKLLNGAELVRFRTRRDGIDVFTESLSVLMRADRSAVAMGGFLGTTKLASPAAKSAAQAFVLSPAQAVAAALADYGFGPAVAMEMQAVSPRGDAGAHDAAGYRHFRMPPGRAGLDGAQLYAPARVKPVWFRLPEGLVAGYYVEVQVADPREGSLDGHGYVVAADDGRLLFRNNHIADAAFTYRVYAETARQFPFPGPQGRNGTPHPTATNNGYQAPFVTQNLFTLDNGPIETADPWLPDGATRTIGNNVEAWANHFGPASNPPGTDMQDAVFDADPNECNVALAPAGDFHACVSAPGTFDYVFDPLQPPKASKSQSMAAVVNLFYVTNWLHDWYYEGNFVESDGNAQDNNFGRGGIGGDSMIALAQDYSGLNNANMYTPADGARPRMRMYVFSGVGGAAVTLTPGGHKAAGTAEFGPAAFDATAGVTLAADAAPPASDGCEAIAGVAGRVALVDRGTCSFKRKALNAQAAGAVGVIVANTLPGIVAMGDDAAIATPITIPVLSISQDDGAALKAALLGGPVSAQLRRVSGTARDGTLDNGIVAHEWGHFISNRLVGDANGLTTNHARGLGEGWSDFHALLMMAAAEDATVPSNPDFTGAYAVGAYVTDGPQIPGVTLSGAYYHGLRRYPYSSQLSINPLTLRHIETGVPLPASPPPAFHGDNAEVHNMGEVWGNMLWSCYTALLRDERRLTFLSTQDRMKRHIITAYKMTPVRPTIIEARDALLAAMSAQDTADQRQCQIALAERGAGVRARFTGDRYGTNNAGVVESTVYGNDMEITGFAWNPTASVYCDSDEFLDNGETGRLTVQVKNHSNTSIAAATLTVASDVPGIGFPNGNTVALPSIGSTKTGSATIDISATGVAAVSVANLSFTVSHPTLVAGPATATLALPLHRDHAQALSTSDDMENGASPWTPTLGQGTVDTSLAWRRVATGPFEHQWKGPAGPVSGLAWLTSPTLNVTAGGTFSMTLRHRHAFELGDFDGGVIEVSTNGGAWTDIEALLGSATVYNGSIAAGTANPLQGRRGFVRQTPGYPAFATTTITFPASLLGQAVQVRFGVGSDSGIDYAGWDLDEVSFTGLVNTPFPGYVAHASQCTTATITGGSPQSAYTASAFALPLQVRLTNAALQPVVGAAVRFVAPASGPSGTFPGGSASALVTTNATGHATAPTFTANGLPGTYNVTAIAGTQSLPMPLTNVLPPYGVITFSTAGTLDLGGASMGTRSAARAVEVRNSGTVAVTISGVSVSGQYGQTNDCGTLASMATCTVNVTFYPSVAGGALNSTLAVPGTLTIASNASNGPNVTLPLTGTAEKSLVRHYYVSILRRAPDAGGKAYWEGEAARVAGLGASVNEAWYALAMTFFNSAEYLAFGRDDTGFLTDLYNTFFNRAPDPGGLAYWQGQLAGGMPRGVALVAFMLSAEFTGFSQNIFGPSTARAEVNLVGDFYRGLLARLPDSGGFDYWVQTFRTAQCQGAASVVSTADSISRSFTTGPEYVARQRGNAQYVEDLYNAFLRRGGDLVGVLHWIGQLDAKAMTRDELRQRFVASPEFNGRVQAVVAQGCLR